MYYIGIIDKDEDSDYGVSFPKFPGCISAGKTRKEAVKLGAEALTMHIKGMREDEIPLPRSSWSLKYTHAKMNKMKPIDTEVFKMHFSFINT